jgi:hypothetical protein
MYRKRKLLAALSGCLFLALAITACKKNDPSAEIINTSYSPEAKQTRLEWDLKTLVDPYKHAGFTNPSWDLYATQALTEFARVRANVLNTNEAWGEIIATNTTLAMEAGCNDPMVRYLYLKFGMSETNSKDEFVNAYCQVASDMQRTSYPDIRKFYAAQRAIDQLYYAYGYGADVQAAHPLFSQMQALIGPPLLGALNDPTMPDEEAYEACDAALASIVGQGIADYAAYTQAYNCLEPIYARNWSNSYTYFLLEGQADVQLAWAARGPGFSDTVTAEGWKLFADRMALAEKALTIAWQMYPHDSRIADHMLEVELGQGKGRDRMELWFDRAMALNPCDYIACSQKLNYLTPKWYGSADEMIEFGRKCAANPDWGANVPLILLDAHSFLAQWPGGTNQPEYWKQPSVWPDLKMAFNRYFQVNPNDTSRFGQYASYAYQCGQWRDFLNMVPKLEPNDYNYFGGKAALDKMIEVAKENGAVSYSP